MQDLSCLNVEELEVKLRLAQQVCSIFQGTMEEQYSGTDVGSTMQSAINVWKEDIRKLEIEILERTLLR